MSDNNQKEPKDDFMGEELEEEIVKEEPAKDGQPKDEQPKEEAPKEEAPKDKPMEEKDLAKESSDADMSIQDWVKAESEAKAQKHAEETKMYLEKNKKRIIIGGISVVVLLLIVIIAAVCHKPGSSSAKKMAYLEGLDVMCGPSGITVSKEGDFLVTDVYGKKIWKVQGDKAVVYAGASTVQDASGQPMGGYMDGSFEESLFKEPWAITPFLDGYAVSDTENHVVRLLRNGSVETINGHSDTLETGDMGVTFDTPTGLATDSQGRLYVADTARGIIYVITEQGQVDIFQEGLHGPMGICWKDGVMYVAETLEHQIVKIDGGVKTVFAGKGEEGDEDGEAHEATFASPQGVAVGKDGAVYVSDTVNASIRRIKNGKVTTILSLPEKELTTSPVSPAGIFCHEDKVYVCDPFSRRVYVMKQ